MSGYVNAGSADAERYPAIIRKCIIRIVCFLSLLNFLGWIDRVNVGFAALQMNAELHFSATAYGFGAGLFFISYVLFGIPSNLVLNRVGARLWIATIMVAWGVISTCFAFIHGEMSFYILRFLLGVAEAGFVPGAVLFMSRWLPPRSRARAFSIFFSCAMAAPMIGGPISGWLLSFTTGIGGFAGWRFMFLCEGVPALVMGIVTAFYLPDRPEDASWLSEEECDCLRTRFRVETVESGSEGEHAQVSRVFTDGRVWALAMTYFFWAISGFGIIFWLPTILKSMGTVSNIEVGFLNSLPFLFAIVGMLVASFFSDRSGERKSYLVVLSLVAGLGLAASGYAPSMQLSLALICLSAVGNWGAQAIFWTIPADYLKGRAAAAGIAMVNNAAGIGGFCGPYLVGWVKDSTGSFPMALAALGLTSFIMAGIVACLPIRRSVRAARPQQQASQMTG